MQITNFDTVVHLFLDQAMKFSATSRSSGNSFSSLQVTNRKGSGDDLKYNLDDGAKEMISKSKESLPKNIENPLQSVDSLRGFEERVEKSWAANDAGDDVKNNPDQTMSDVAKEIHFESQESLLKNEENSVQSESEEHAKNWSAINYMEESDTFSGEDCGIKCYNLAIVRRRKWLPAQVVGALVQKVKINMFKYDVK